MKSSVTFSDYIDPSFDNYGDSGLFAKKVGGLDVGKAFNVTGLTANNCASRANVIGKRYSPQRKYGVHKLDDNTVQIVRKE